MSVGSMNIPQHKQVVGVRTTQNRGFTPEEIAEVCVQKIVSVSDTAPPAIREQAKAFADNIEEVVTFYMKRAIESDRTSVYNALNEAGKPDLAELIRRL